MENEFESTDVVETPIGVYVKTDSNNAIIDIRSDVFISDKTEWTKIDEGLGDKYLHAQSLYLEKPLREHGIYNYEYANGIVRERDKTADLEVVQTQKATEIRIAKIRVRLSALTEDFVQAECGEIIDDLAERKSEFVTLHNELRVLQGKVPREIRKTEQE